MGALTSRQNERDVETDLQSLHHYRYPSKNGNYFATHFIMGGERFDAPQPEAYLFGENNDLNFLGNRPTPFPYPPPQSNEPTKTLKSHVNIRKESLRMVKIVAPSSKGDAPNYHYNIEFMFDCDAEITITIYYFATEEITPNGIVFTVKDESLTSDTYRYSVGSGQLFCQPLHTFDPNKFTEEDLTYNMEKEVIPVAIHCVTTEETKQSHTTIAVVDKHSDGSFVLKALKQRIFIDGLSYLLQEIYGVENKNIEVSKMDDLEDNGSECVICMCDIRDTLILPCRHLCLCNACADSLRYQASNCPICRAPFRALLQLRAVRKSNSVESTEENIPAGYKAVSLIEALNGPYIRPSRSASLKSAKNSIKSLNVENTDEQNKNLLFIKRNTVKEVNEKQEDNHEEEELDSEAEKYSPLLQPKDKLTSVSKPNTSKEVKRNSNKRRHKEETKFAGKSEEEASNSV